MDIRRVDENFAVAPQLQPEDMAAVAAAGYGTIVCNRPDGEEEDQPSADAMRAAAEAAGMGFGFIPVRSGVFPTDAIDAFRSVRRTSEAPVLAYCRTGTRSITLDTLANHEGLSVDARLQRAADAGYDLSALRTTLNAETAAHGLAAPR